MIKIEAGIYPPSLLGTVFSFKENFISGLSVKAVEKISSILTSDPELSAGDRIYDDAGNLDSAKLGIEMRNYGKAVGLDNNETASLQAFAEYYHAYRLPFPDKSETEPAESIFGYLVNDSMDWDVLVKLDLDGKVIAAASGQLLKVKVSDVETISVAWNEHTWRAPAAQGKGIGGEVFQAFEKHWKKKGAQMIVIEVDNPYALSTNPDGFLGTETNTPSQVAMRERYWKEKEGQSMDPFKRFQFWSRQGFGIITVQDSKGQSICLPYNQISMDPENGQPPCETIFLAAKILDSGLHGREFKPLQINEIYKATQATISEDYQRYPSFLRAQEYLRNVTEASVTYTELDSAAARQILALTANEKKTYLLGDLPDRPDIDEPKFEDLSFAPRP